jgi:CRISPR-associated protein Cas1
MVVQIETWPARNVAEYAYCPRLFYLMEVEGIHVASRDTEAGQRIHKRVNSPSARRTKKDGAAKSDEGANADTDSPRVERSLTLSDESLGLMAVLDLAEITGTNAVPIEYRKGRPKRPFKNGDEELPAEPWPTDRIQLAFQAILLECAGYTVSKGILYYASERCRLDVAITDELRQEAMRTGRLEPSIGALHVSRPGRPALALDLMEPFRPLIADSLTITAFNRSELRP